MPVGPRPLDENAILEAASRSDCIVTLEENVLAGGFGSAVLEVLEIPRHVVSSYYKEIGSSGHLR